MLPTEAYLVKETSNNNKNGLLQLQHITQGAFLVRTVFTLIKLDSK